MSTIKINRAVKLAAIGRNPGPCADMLVMIPLSVRDALTARRLADMLDALWHACSASKAIAAAEACQNGAVWDASVGRLRDVVA